MSGRDVVEALLDLMEQDALPAGHVSAHWQRFGRETTVRREGTGIGLRASGFETVGPMGPAGRALAAIERWSYRGVTRRLLSFPPVWKQAARLARDLGADANFNVFKSACALATLMDTWGERALSPRTFVLIGDGFGFFGALVARCVPESRIFCVDLPKQLVVQADTHRRADPHLRAAVIGATSGGPRDERVTYVPPDLIDHAPGPIDCAVNIASMQEMTHESIARYFAFLRRRSGVESLFYCVNRAEKALPDGTVVRFADYPWSTRDEILLDGPCPYYTHYLSPYTTARGPRVLGVRVPFIDHFDGVHLHRLARLTSG